MKTNKYILLLAALLLLAACSSEKNIHKFLPEGNYNLIYPESKMNDSLNQISLVAIPDVFGNSAISYEREVENSENRSRKIINSKDFIESIIAPNEENKEVIEALTKNLEQVTLITDSSGYVSFSHPITETFAKHKELNISGNVGGTDIFEFNKVKGKYQFRPWSHCSIFGIPILHVGDTIKTIALFHFSMGFGQDISICPEPKRKFKYKFCY